MGGPVECARTTARPLTRCRTIRVMAAPAAPGVHRAGPAERVDGRGPRRRREDDRSSGSGACTKTFRGLTALTRVRPRPAGRPDPRRHRPERGRQDHAVPRPVGVPAGHRPARSRSTAGTSPAAPSYQRRPARDRPGRSRTSGCSATQSVLDNVIGRGPAGTRSGRCSGNAAVEPVLPAPGARARRTRASELLELFGLAAAARPRWPGNLAYGDQRRLEIARAVGQPAPDPAARRAERRHEPGRDAGAAPA